MNGSCSSSSVCGFLPFGPYCWTPCSALFTFTVICNHPFQQLQYYIVLPLLEIFKSSPPLINPFCQRFFFYNYGFLKQALKRVKLSPRLILQSSYSVDVINFSPQLFISLQLAFLIIFT